MAQFPRIASLIAAASLATLSGCSTPDLFQTPEPEAESIYGAYLAARYADRIVLLDGGQVVAVGAPASVMTAERLSAVYGTPVHVEHHSALERLVVIA